MNHKRYFGSFLAAGFRNARVVVVLMLFTLPASAQTLYLVTEEWPGLIDDTDQGPDGVLWEITSDVLEAMGYEVQLEFVPWRRAQRMVQENVRDGILGIGITAEREKQFRFPGEALLISETAVYTTKARAFKYEGLDSMEGMKVGVSPGYTYSSEVSTATHFETVEVSSINSGLQMLLLGRIDAMLANRTVVAREAKRLGIGDQIEASRKPVSGGPVYLAFSPETTEAFLGAFTLALKHYKNSGAYPVERFR